MSNWYRFTIALVLLTGALFIALIRNESTAFVIAILIIIAHEFKRHT